MCSDDQPKSDVQAQADIGVAFHIQDVGAEAAATFMADFAASKRLVERYFAATRFEPVFTGALEVYVCKYSPPTSEALLPTWEGHRGQMKFAAMRAEGRTAALVHELAHVHAPNQVRFLTEGFSTYLEEMIGNLDAYPTFGGPIEVQMKALSATALASVDLTVFDGVSTRRGALLGDHVGLETAIPNGGDREAYSYLVAGSFVKYLINSYGLFRFKSLYDLTPLTPLVATPADPARYQVVYGKTLATLQAEWAAWLQSN